MQVIRIKILISWLLLHLYFFPYVMPPIFKMSHTFKPRSSKFYLLLRTCLRTPDSCSQFWLLFLTDSTGQTLDSVPYHCPLPKPSSKSPHINMRTTIQLPKLATQCFISSLSSSPRAVYFHILLVLPLKHIFKLLLCSSIAIMLPRGFFPSKLLILVQKIICPVCRRMLVTSLESIH